jgi:endonuclease III-like uncharacterized protein
MKQAIKHIGTHTFKQLPKWVAQHPHFCNTLHPDGKQYTEIVLNNVCEQSTEPKLVSKIIKNIAREVSLKKTKIGKNESAQDDIENEDNQNE